MSIRKSWRNPNRPKPDVLAGLQLGSWTVGAHTQTNSANPEGLRSYHLCTCRCGGTEWINDIYLRNARAPTCICETVTGERLPIGRKVAAGGIPAKQWRQIVNSAKERSISFEITASEAWDLFTKQRRFCALTGRRIHFGKEREHATASLDRIDSLLPYRLDNCQWLHKDVNRLKWNLSQAELLLLCSSVVRHAAKAGLCTTAMANQ